MCIRASLNAAVDDAIDACRRARQRGGNQVGLLDRADADTRCLLYTSDAADERSSVDLGGRRIIQKNTTEGNQRVHESTNQLDSDKHNTSR